MKHCVACAADFEAVDWRCPGCGFAPETVNGWPTFAAEHVGGGPKEFNRAVYARMMACEERSFYFRARRRLILWALDAYFPAARRFYDLGTGTGFVLAAIRGARPDIELWGSDLAFDSLALTAARVGKGATLFHTDAASIPFTDHFDVVGAFDVIEHVPDDRGALGAIGRSIRPGGGVLVTVPQHMVLWSRLDEETGHQRRYTGNELAAKVADAGFEVLLDTSFMATLFLPQYVSRRVLSRKPGTTFENEHLLPRPLNGLLEALLAGELALIRTGVRFPFGGLRIVAGRKPCA